jgi:hypothetical protein
VCLRRDPGGTRHAEERREATREKAVGPRVSVCFWSCECEGEGGGILFSALRQRIALGAGTRRLHVVTRPHVLTTSNFPSLTG